MTLIYDSNSTQYLQVGKLRKIVKLNNIITPLVVVSLSE